jgi:hypothetical protein
VLTGYYVVGEYNTLNGTEILVSRAGRPEGQGLPSWTVRGWLEEALRKDLLGVKEA